MSHTTTTTWGHTHTHTHTHTHQIDYIYYLVQTIKTLLGTETVTRYESLHFVESEDRRVGKSYIAIQK